MEVCDTKKSDENKNRSLDASPTVENGTKSFTFDEIFEEAKFGRFNFCVIFLSGVIITYSLVETTAIAYVLPISQCDLNFTESQKGILGAASFAGAIISAQFWGYLADTLGRKKVLTPSLFISFLSSSFSSLAGQFWLLVSLRFCAGFFAFGGSSVIYTYLGELHGTKWRSRAILGASFVFGFTYVLIPIEAWLVINQDWELNVPYLAITYKPWRLFFVICGLPGLICSICLLKCPESPKFLLSQDRKNEAIEVLRRIYSINTGANGDSLKILSLTAGNDDRHIKAPIDKSIKSILTSIYNQTAVLLNTEYIRKTMLACTLQFGIKATCNGLYVWFVGILNQVIKFMNSNPDNNTTLCEIVYSYKQTTSILKDVNSGECAVKLELSTYMYSLVLDILYMIGFGVMGFLVNTVGIIPLMFVISIVTGLCGIAIMFVKIPLLSISLYVALLLCGLVVPVLSAATVDLYPTHIRSMVVCLALMMGRLGSLVGSSIVGLLIENHCESAFLLSGISLILCGFLAFLIPISKKTAKEEISVDYMVGRYLKYNDES